MTYTYDFIDGNIIIKNVAGLDLIVKGDEGQAIVNQIVLLAGKENSEQKISDLLEGYINKPQPEFTPEQQDIYEFFVDWMTKFNNDGLELTNEDLLAAFVKAKQETGYFAEVDEI